MDAAEWLARFDDAATAWRAERDRLWTRVAAGSTEPAVAAVGPVIIEPGREVWLGDRDDEPAALVRLANAAMGAGWSVRIVRAAAAVPRLGALETWSLRCARADERLIAVWWVNDGKATFNLGVYQGPMATGVQRLGMETLATRARKIAKAAAEGRTIPGPLTTRGVMDAINGVRLP